MKKVYDSVSWDFIKEVLKKMNFPKKFIEWIMVCITSPKFSVMVNGNPAGFFSSTRGLRQGDPISPLLFCLVMEIFSSLLEKEVREKRISLIPKCKGMRLSHLIFADDLMIFSKANKESLEAINNTLRRFSKIFGLHVNKEKSTQIFAGVTTKMSEQLRQVTGFTLGALPMQYLGVPLVSGRLSYQECSSIVDKVQKWLAGWKNRPLSYAGRLTLIKSVLQGSYIYWS